MGTPRLPHPFLLHQTCWRTAWRRRQQPVVPWFSGTYSTGAGLFQAKAVALSPACGRGYRTSPALRRVQCTLWAHPCPWPPGLDMNVLELTNTQETPCLPEAGPRGSVGSTTLGWRWDGAGVALGWCWDGAGRDFLFPGGVWAAPICFNVLQRVYNRQTPRERPQEREPASMGGRGEIARQPGPVWWEPPDTGEHPMGTRHGPTCKLPGRSHANTRAALGTC